MPADICNLGSGFLATDHYELSLKSRHSRPTITLCLVVTSQFLCGVLDVTLVPYFSLASLCSVMLSSDNRNIMDYWIFNARYCFEYVSLCFWCD